MGGKRRLPGGLPRLLSNHNTPEGRQLRRAFRALELECGPLHSELLRFQAGRVALLEVNLTASSRALDAARRQRMGGKGRRPSERRIERLARRVGLDDGSYQAALDRLRELAGRNGHKKPSSGAELLERWHREGSA
jgi:hypothetical protein